MTEYILNAGTVTVASGGTTVTGSGTAFLDLFPGALIWLGTQTRPNVVASIASNTSLTLEFASPSAVTGGAWTAVNVPGAYQAIQVISQLYASIGSAVDVTTPEKRIVLASQTGEEMIYFRNGTPGLAQNELFRMGLTAADQNVWRVQRSANGTTWTDVLTINRTTGAIVFAGLTVTADQISNSTATGRSVLTGDAAAGRTALGAAPLANPSFTGNLTAAGTLNSGGTGNIGGNLFVGDQATLTQIVIRGAAGQLRSIFFRSADVNRWEDRIDNTAESGSNAGSNWSRVRYSDAGAGLGAIQTWRRSDGAILYPGIATTASAANAFLDSADSNRIMRSTSSQAYKRDIEALDFWRARDFLNAARPVWYRSKSDADNPLWGFYGFIAEEIAAINPGLVFWGYQDDQYETVEWEEDRTITEGEGENAVTRVETVPMSERRLKPGEQKRPDGVMYDRLTVFLTAIAQDQAKEIVDLKTDNAALEARLLALEARLSAAGI